MASIEFEWDAAKARANLHKHRISFQEARSVFADPLATTVPDPDHPVGERRFVTIGRGKARWSLSPIRPEGLESASSALGG